MFLKPKNAQHVTNLITRYLIFDVGVVGVIRCSECGHIFEYCKDQKLKHEVKKSNYKLLYVNNNHEMNRIRNFKS